MRPSAQRGSENQTIAGTELPSAQRGSVNQAFASTSERCPMAAFCCAAVACHLAQSDPAILCDLGNFQLAKKAMLGVSTGANITGPSHISIEAELKLPQ